MTHQIRRLAVVILIVIVAGVILASSSGISGGGLGANSGNSVCSTTEITNTAGQKSGNTECSNLKQFTVLVDGEKLYDSSSGQTGQISKKLTFSITASKPVQVTTLQVGLSAYIGSTKVASNNTITSFDGTPNKAQVIGLTITGLKLESYSYLFANGGTLRYVVSGNESLRFTDNSILLKRFEGIAGNASLSFVSQSPVVKTTDECGGCPLNPTGSAYAVPLAGATSITVRVVDEKGGAWAPAIGSSISGSQLCWNALRLTQPCSITPSSFSGTVNSASEYTFSVTSVTVGSFDGYYLNSAGVVACCAPMYATVGYSGTLKFATPWTSTAPSQTVYSSLDFQIGIASNPTSQVGGTVYITPPCDWFHTNKFCTA